MSAQLLLLEHVATETEGMVFAHMRDTAAVRGDTAERLPSIVMLEVILLSLPLVSLMLRQQLQPIKLTQGSALMEKKVMGFALKNPCVAQTGVTVARVKRIVSLRGFSLKIVMNHPMERVAVVE